MSLINMDYYKCNLSMHRLKYLVEAGRALMHLLSTQFAYVNKLINMYISHLPSTWVKETSMQICSQEHGAYACIYIYK